MQPLVEELTAALLQGAAEGVVFALLAVALVLTWRTGRHLDVAIAEQAGAAALVLHLLHVEVGVGYVPAGVAAVAVPVLLGLGVERALPPPRPDGGGLAAPLATAGLALLLIGATGLAAGGGWLRVPPLLPAVALDLPGALTVQHLVVLVTGVLAGGALWVLSRSPAAAVARAAGDDPELAGLLGIPPARVGAPVWGLAGGLAGIAGVAAAPLLDLAPATFSLAALVPALAAAVVAGGRSVALAAAAGLAIGCLGQLLAVALPLPAPAVLVAGAVLWAVPLVAPRRMAVRA